MIKTITVCCSASFFKESIKVGDHFKKVKKGDAILVLNLEKNSIKGYIGGNTLMEMTIAFLNKKPIYIYNEIQDGFMLQEEILSLNPIFINKNLNLIK